MQKTRQNWERVPLLTQPSGKPMRPVSVLHRHLTAKTVVPAHSHGWGQLVYSGQGVLDVITPGGRYLLPPDRAVWVPPDEPHEISTLNGAEISSIYITADAGTSLPVECQVVEISPLLRALIFEARRQPIEYQWHSPSGRLFRTLRDQIAIARPAPLYLPLPEDQRLLKVCYYLQQNPEDIRTLADWGVQVGASERTLQRLFQKETRLTFQQWRQQLRLQVALQRLIDSRESITAIAVGLGYESASAFIAMFQKQLGITPGEYRKSLTAMPVNTQSGN